MALTINKYHGKYNLSKRSGGVGSIKYIVIHYTAGTGSAKNNCIYFSGGNRGASADYFVDDNGVWEYNDPSSGLYSWAVGDGKGKYGITNSNSISIEVVNTGSAFSAKEIEYLKQLVPYLMKRYNVPADRVVRHYDASHKTCPAYYVNNPSKWTELHKVITSGSGNVSASTGSTSKPSASTGKLSVDGYGGPATVKELQRQLGTVADGVISKQRSSLKKYWTGFQSNVWRNTSSGGSIMVKALQRKIGVSADGVLGRDSAKALQNWLKRKGYNPGTIDGYAGANTMKALQKALNARAFK